MTCQQEKTPSTTSAFPFSRRLLLFLVCCLLYFLLPISLSRFCFLFHFTHNFHPTLSVKGNCCLCESSSHLPIEPRANSSLMPKALAPKAPIRPPSHNHPPRSSSMSQSQGSFGITTWSSTATRTQGTTTLITASAKVPRRKVPKCALKSKTQGLSSAAMPGKRSVTQ